MTYPNVPRGTFPEFCASVEARRVSEGAPRFGHSSGASLSLRIARLSASQATMARIDRCQRNCPGHPPAKIRIIPANSLRPRAGG